jgi:hypothetical protein
MALRWRSGSAFERGKTGRPGSDVRVGASGDDLRGRVTVGRATGGVGVGLLYEGVDTLCGLQGCGAWRTVGREGLSCRRRMVMGSDERLRLALLRSRCSL